MSAEPRQNPHPRDTTAAEGLGAELLAEYDYDLPPAAIAQEPAAPRDHSRLLILHRGDGRREHARFRDLGRYLCAGDLLVVNDTRVIPARLRGRRMTSGGRVELLLVRELEEDHWEALVRLSGRARAGLRIDLSAGYVAELVAPREPPHWEIAVRGPRPLREQLDSLGRVPLPPYIRRADGPQDRDWYQTVFAQHPGAVAAPTAGLHFTPELLERLQCGGIGLAPLTLHVGPGTFRPVGEEELRQGRLHAERFVLPAATAGAIDAARRRGGRVIAVGTTCARVLESCAQGDRRVRSAAGETDLFIRPPYAPRVADALVTNFHLPRTSLLLLVAAFAGREQVLAAYRDALVRGYRFYSYGDAMLIL